MVSVSLYHHKERSAHKSSSQTYEAVSAYNRSDDLGATTHIPKVPVQHLNVTVNDLQCDELVVPRPDSAHEEQRGVSPVYDLRICAGRPSVSIHSQEFKDCLHLYTRGSYTSLSA